MKTEKNMTTEDRMRRQQAQDVRIMRLSSPKAFFLLAAFFSFLLSVALFFTGSREQGIFVGIWVPSILSAGNLILGGRNR